jgi:hypothetical protein
MFMPLTIGPVAAAPPLLIPPEAIWPVINPALLGNAVPFSFIDDLLPYIAPISVSVS